MDLASQPGASSWLTSLPIKENWHLSPERCLTHVELCAITGCPTRPQPTVPVLPPCYSLCLWCPLVIHCACGAPLLFTVPVVPPCYSLCLWCPLVIHCACGAPLLFTVPVVPPCYSLCLWCPLVIHHLLSCPSGGFPSLRHEIRDLTARLL